MRTTYDVSVVYDLAALMAEKNLGTGEALTQADEKITAEIEKVDSRAVRIGSGFGGYRDIQFRVPGPLTPENFETFKDALVASLGLTVLYEIVQEVWVEDGDELDQDEDSPHALIWESYGHIEAA